MVADGFVSPAVCDVVVGLGEDVVLPGSTLLRGEGDEAGDGAAF